VTGASALRATRKAPALSQHAAAELIPIGHGHSYTGTTFGWIFQAGLPGGDAYPFEFKLTSEPADQFGLAHSASRGVPMQPPAAALYGATADSAFDDLTAKVLCTLSVQTRMEPPASEEQERVRRPRP